MAWRGHLVGLLLLGALHGQAQVYGKKRLVFDVGGGGGGLMFTQAHGPDDILRGASVVGCGVQYGFGKRIGLAFRYERMSARRGILEAGPSRVAGYTAAIHVVMGRWERSEVDGSLGFGPANITLSADRNRMPREGAGGSVMAGLRWSRAVTPTVGYAVGATAHTSAPVGMADERGAVYLADGTPLEVGFNSLGLHAALLVRF